MWPLWLSIRHVHCRVWRRQSSSLQLKAQRKVLLACFKVLFEGWHLVVEQMQVLQAVELSSSHCCIWVLLCPSTSHVCRAGTLAVLCMPTWPVAEAEMLWMKVALAGGMLQIPVVEFR